MPFLHARAQIPVCLVTQPVGREFCQPARLRALRGRHCLCGCHCPHGRPGGAEALRVRARFGCVQNASCVRWCVCVTFRLKTALLKCERSPLLMGGLGAGGRCHLPECLVHTCMYVFHFLADLCWFHKLCTKLWLHLGKCKRWWFPWLHGLARATHPFCVSWLPGVDCFLANGFINSSNN